MQKRQPWLLSALCLKTEVAFVFYDKFVELCERANVTRTKACTDCDLSRTAWRKWMEGGTPNGVAVSRFAEYFGVSVDYLLGAETKKEPSTDNGEKLSAAEAELLELFRRVPEDQQQLVLQMIRVALGNRK